MLWALVTIDSLGANPLALDWQLAERSEIWQTAYGSNIDPLSRRKHKELMAQLNKMDWSLSKDPELLATCQDFVETFHVYQGPANWLRATRAEYKDEGHISRRFRPIWKALGIERGLGMPTLE